MFEAFRRTAMSTTISEALDLSTALTDKDGGLVCTGAGVPVFFGFLGKAVKSVI